MTPALITVWATSVFRGSYHYVPQIVTQFGFDAEAVVNWESNLRQDGIELPIHVGMAGQAPLRQLLGCAMRCGVTASMRMLVGKASPYA